MKILRLLLLALTFLVSCKSNETKVKEEELQLKERELTIREKELNQREQQSIQQPKNTPPLQLTTKEVPQSYASTQNISGTKYVYVLIKTKVPKLVHVEGMNMENPISGLNTKTSDINTVSFTNYTYVSDIIEIRGFNESSKYKCLDEFEKNVQHNFYYVKIQFEAEVHTKAGTFSDESERLIEEGDPKIIERNCLVFDSYAAASESKKRSRSN